MTKRAIDRLQNYYGIAVRQNPNDLLGMQKAVCASLFHVASSKGNNYTTLTVQLERTVGVNTNKTNLPDLTHTSLGLVYLSL